MTPQTGPDSPWVFVILAVILVLVVIVERRREVRRRAKLLGRPRCQVIGCEPQLSTRWLPHHGIYACDRCADELLELRRGFGGAA